jgi:KaiC/GvpD/RAD55 family RecA-like ATPase
MVKDELVQRSPVRVFEKSIHGGLKAGEIGIIAAPSGIGKTSVLVQIALDKLLQGRKVIHISYTKHTDYVLAWYEDIFDEFIKKKNLENPEEVKNEAVRNRVLLKFSQEGVSGEQVQRSLKALIRDGGFNAEAIIIDGFDFSLQDPDRLAGVRDMAKELSLSVWYSCTIKGGDAYDKQGIPVLLKDALPSIDVIIALDPKADHIDLKVCKDRDRYNPEQMALKLDPKTLLILEG